MTPETSRILSAATSVSASSDATLVTKGLASLELRSMLPCTGCIICFRHAQASITPGESNLPCGHYLHHNLPEMLLSYYVVGFEQSWGMYGLLDERARS